VSANYNDTSHDNAVTDGQTSRSVSVNYVGDRDISLAMLTSGRRTKSSLCTSN